jgi:HPr kinase/phosphorylase
MSVTVANFLEQGRTSCELEVVAGEAYLNRTIKEGAINRPGLALAGFFRHFANLRIQVFGLAENAYLKDLPADQRNERLASLFAQRIPCVVMTRGRQAPPELIECAEKHRVPVLKTPLITSHFINRATLIMENLAAPTLRFQGTMIELMGIGVLMEGQPGIGKSETALALIERGHSLVSDDLTVLRRDSTGAIVGSADALIRYHMEIRGLGIIHVPSLFGVASMRREMRLDLLIRLEPFNENTPYNRSGLNNDSAVLLGTPIPKITIPVAAGRDIAHVVEVAALNQKLKQLGHDAAKELDDKLVSVLTRKGRRP